MLESEANEILKTFGLKVQRMAEDIGISMIASYGLPHINGCASGGLTMCALEKQEDTLIIIENIGESLMKFSNSMIENKSQRIFENDRRS